MASVVVGDVVTGVDVEGVDVGEVVLEIEVPVSEVACTSVAGL